MAPSSKRHKKYISSKLAKPSKKFKSFLPYLVNLRKHRGKEQNHIINSSTNPQLKSIQTICKNLKGGGIFLSQARKKRLHKYKGLIRSLANSQLSQKKKKKLLTQKGGFLGALLGSVLPLLIGQLIKR